MLRQGFSLCLIFMIKIFTVLFVALSFFAPTISEAHELETNSEVSVLMHIEPNDHPIAGQESKIYFSFNGKDFVAEKCECSVIIYQNANQIHISTLAAEKQSFLLFTFPANGKYKINLTGTPREGAPFEKFSFNYDIDVRDQAATNELMEHDHGDGFFTHHGLHLIIFGSAFLFLIGYLIYDYKKTGTWRKG
jgi:hypothetical protein